MAELVQRDAQHLAAAAFAGQVAGLQGAATLLALSPTGERVLGQRVFVVQRPAATADAAGGAAALASASDELIGQMVRWVDGARR